MSIRGHEFNVRRVAFTLASLFALAIGAIASLSAAGSTGFSFQSLDSGFTQSLFGVTQLPDDGSGYASILGGVAFAPDGDPWVADCVFYGTRLHRFDTQSSSPATHGTTSLHPETIVETAGGCGLTNNPDGFLYSNSMDGVVRLDANTGLPAAWPDGTSVPHGLPGNALGITSDPKTGHVIYVGDSCHPSLNPDATTCSIYDVDPATGAVTTFASLDRTQVPFVDGIYFDPTGTYLFMANRGNDDESHFLTVLRRPENSVPATALPQIAQSVPMSSDPDGVAFKASAPRFVVTNDEEGGTMTRFSYSSDDYATTPLVSSFADGGFRGDLLNVGADGCIYTTQGRNALTTDHGTRYDDGTETTEDSLVRICSVSTAADAAFAPGPGVKATVITAQVCSAHIGDFVWSDLNRNGVQDPGEPGLANVALTLRNASGSVVSTTMTGASGGYGFDASCNASYTVEVTPPPGYAASPSYVGSPDTDSNGNPAVVTVPAGGLTELSIDFGYILGSLSGTVYVDANGNGVRDAGETGLPGVTVSMNGGAAGTTTTAADGSYTFVQLPGAGYSVASQAVANGFALATTSPLAVTLAAGQNRTGVDFGYVPGSLAGTVYVDANGNGVRDSGEAGIGGVAVTLSGGAGGTVTTASDGSYRFLQLLSASYSIASPAIAAGLARSTASPLAASLAAGQNLGGLDFGYAPGRISGFAYADANKNGTRQTTEPGLAGVTVTLSGAASATTTTAADGSYAFTGLIAGAYSVSAPASALGLTRLTASPLGVTISAGQTVPEVNFGYTETIAPTCTEQTYKGPPFKGTMTFQDAGGGIVSLVIVQNINFAVTLPTFTGPSKAPLMVTGTRIDATKSATLTVKATDLFGNVLSCDPVVTTITKLRHEQGNQTITDLPFAEHLVTVSNDSPGLRQMEIEVNGVSFKVKNLDDNEVRTIDVVSAMKHDNQNTIVLIPKGKKGESATVTIADH